MNKIKLYLLKRKAKRLWIEICNRRDSLSCGRTLEDVISPKLWWLKEQFNIIWEQIKVLDPDAPDNPLKNGETV